MLIISGAQGVGKTTLINLLLELRPVLKLSISSTTRCKRVGEKLGEYNFLTEEEFKQKHTSGEFIEVVEVHGYLYGTEKKYFSHGIILNVTASSIENFITLIGENTNYVSIFIDAPLHLIRERMENRKDEHIDKKLEFSMNEIIYKKYFHHIISNDGDINHTLDNLLIIVDQYLKTP